MRLRFAFCLFALLNFSNAVAQWGAPYRNGWIAYGKPYVKIGVTQSGIHKLPLSILPAEFPVGDLTKLQLWHRGKQIAIISTENKEIVFYAVPNDGASDSLLYRPMSARMNPYWSMYSDESAYFLTVGDTAGLRADKSNREVDTNYSSVNAHTGRILSTYKTEYSLSTASYLMPTFINSYFEIGASRTGKASLEGKASSFSFQLANYTNTGEKPVVKLLIHGRSPGIKNIEISAGKTDQSLRLVNKLPADGFIGVSYSFELEPDDIDSQGKGVLNLKAVGTNTVDGYSLAYYSISYPQLTDMKGKTSAEFLLKKATDAYSRLTVSNAPATASILDITNPDKPVLIQGSGADVMVPRVTGREAKILVSSESITIQKAKVSGISLAAKYPTNVNYIIVTSENLLDGAKQYAAYRGTAQGGGYSTLVVNIKDIYNQFNYGEPSPVAIRGFIDYMISDGKKDKYLHLIGKSITYNERMVRELPDEVPSVGYPASDILLVEGLGGTARDVPAIPVGRTSATTNQQVLDYLGKVKEYEGNVTGNYGWRKNVLHLNGGKTAAEITQLKTLLQDLEPQIVNGIIGGSVKPFAKKQAISEVETVNITPEVNNGVGLITYFGHGSTTVTDLDMGYVTDAARGYRNAGMYPMMYFNGCGVGNIFNAKFNTNPGASDRYTLSMDWLLTPNKGAIAIIANSFESFVSPSSVYLEMLYRAMFSDSTTYNLSIGKIQQALAKRIVNGNPDMYSLGNLHQSILQGDPALYLVSVANSDYSVDPDEGIKLSSESADKTIGNSSSLRLDVRVDNLGRYQPAEKLLVEVTYYLKDEENTSAKTISGFAYHDTVTISIPIRGQVEKIEVKLDPQNVIKELSKSNNKAELFVDWDVAKNESVYPQGSVKDVVPPILSGLFNGRTIKNEEVITTSTSIAIKVEDNRFLSPDTSRVNVYLKACADNSCDFERLAFSSGDLTIEALTDYSLIVKLENTQMQVGFYELLVTAADEAGNSSTAPYQIRFEVGSADDGVFRVVASPNPASSYLRFEAGLSDENLPEKISWAIYDQRGILIYQSQIDKPKAGLNEWYWQPQQSGSGLYFFKVACIIKDAEVRSVRGKIVLVK